MWKYTFPFLLIPFAFAGGVGAPDAQDPLAPADESGVEEITAGLRGGVERGLRFLVSQQNENGSWPSQVGAKIGENYSVQSLEDHVGVTALATMALMANGNLPGKGRYGKEVEKGLDYVLKSVQPDGFIAAHGTRMYSHAFAALFLGEVYGMTHREDVKERLERSVRLIIRSQNERGGWRYLPFDRDSDISITVCQVQALRVARNNGIHVPYEAIEKAIEYIRSSHVSRSALSIYSGGFKYQPMSAENAYNRITYSLTGAGLTALYGTGVYNDPILSQGLSFLERREHWPDTRAAARFGAPLPYNYFYGHYYAAQAMFQAGGERWGRFFPRVRDEILSFQHGDGSWRDAVGENYATAMACLVLQIPYRYLPIYQR